MNLSDDPQIGPSGTQADRLRDTILILAHHGMS